MRKTDRVVYWAFHEQSERGSVGYVGCSKYGLRQRRLRHEAEVASGSSCKFHRAMRKYPKEVWIWTILEDGFESDEAMNAAEVYWIKEFGTKIEGYNSTDGGDGVVGLLFSPNKGRRMREETKAKLRLANLGKELSEETKQKISASVD